MARTDGPNSYTGNYTGPPEHEPEWSRRQRAESTSPEAHAAVEEALAGLQVPLDPEGAAAHATVIQGGFSTAAVEAPRILHDALRILLSGNGLDERFAKGVRDTLAWIDLHSDDHEVQSEMARFEGRWTSRTVWREDDVVAILGWRPALERALAQEERERLGPMHPRYAGTHRTWEGYLTAANARAVRDRIERDFAGRWVNTTTVYENAGWRPRVHPSFRLETNCWTDGQKTPVRLDGSPGGDRGLPSAHIMWSGGHYTWYLDTRVTDQAAAECAHPSDQVRVQFGYAAGQPQMTVEQRVPDGTRVFLVLSAEDHTEHDPAPDSNVDPALATEAVVKAWDQAKKMVEASWPGPTWGADHYAVEVSWRLRICRSAGLDVAPLIEEWRARYVAYQTNGGRMKYRPI